MGFYEYIIKETTVKEVGLVGKDAYIKNLTRLSKKSLDDCLRKK